MKSFFAFIAFVLFVNATFAEDLLPLIQPSNNGLVIAKVERDNGHSAEFKGHIWITGTLIAEWDRVWAEATENALEVRLIPDQRSIKILPHFERYPVRKLELVNEQETMRLTFNKTLLAKLKTKKINRIEAKGSFLIEEYIVGVECDAPWARAKVIRTRIPKQPHIFTKEHEGC